MILHKLLTLYFFKKSYYLLAIKIFLLATTARLFYMQCIFLKSFVDPCGPGYSVRKSLRKSQKLLTYKFQTTVKSKRKLFWVLCVEFFLFSMFIFHSRESKLYCCLLDEMSALAWGVAISKVSGPPVFHIKMGLSRLVSCPKTEQANLLACFPQHSLNTKRHAGRL